MELDALDHEHVVQVQPAAHAMRTRAFVDPRLFQNFLVALQEQRGLKPDSFKIFVDDLNITVCLPCRMPFLRPFETPSQAMSSAQFAAAMRRQPRADVLLIHKM